MTVKRGAVPSPACGGGLGRGPSGDRFAGAASARPPSLTLPPQSGEREVFRRLAIAFVSFTTAAVLAATIAVAQVAQRVDSVAITVSDMDRALAFYTRVLPFDLVSEVDISGDDYARLFGVFGMHARIIKLGLGKERIELVQFLTPAGRPVPADSRSNDLWFQHVAIIVSDMKEAYAHLRRHDVTHASTGPQVLPDWNPSAGGIAAFYFKDPDGNHLEILQFPPGKGDPRWQSKAKLFLGIDHTAIVVGDTDRSLTFWRDTLGFRVAGHAENYGPAQERLNNVFGVRLRITGLVAPKGGIAVEFLEYLAPHTGRAAPIDTRANDLWHWHINIATRDAVAVAKVLRQRRYSWVSPGAIRGLDGRMGYTAGIMARDPDGHGVLFRE